MALVIAGGHGWGLTGLDQAQLDERGRETQAPANPTEQLA
jgi:hypothetical protein